MSVARGEVDAISRAANERNNAMHQAVRLERWGAARDALWAVIEPLLGEGASVALVGAGSADDVPLVRITERAARVDLVDFDPRSLRRATQRLDRRSAERVHLVETDVTGGCADQVLQAARDGSTPPNALALPTDALGSGDYDLVVGDLLYTQLLHAGLIQLGIVGDEQHAFMRRYDQPLATALVQRIQASLAPGGHAVHVHDLACWAAAHDQPLPLDAVLRNPEAFWSTLRRHDRCDPHLVLERLGADVRSVAWWEWPFEPNKRFLVRATVARAGTLSA